MCSIGLSINFCIFHISSQIFLGDFWNSVFCCIFIIEIFWNTRIGIWSVHLCNVRDGNLSLRCRHNYPKIFANFKFIRKFGNFYRKEYVKRAFLQRLCIFVIASNVFFSKQGLLVRVQWPWSMSWLQRLNGCPNWFIWF